MLRQSFLNWRCLHAVKGPDDDLRLVEDGPTRQLIGGRLFGNALK